MSKLTSSIPCNSSDFPYVLLTIEESEDNMHKAPLLSKAQASQKKEYSSYRDLKTEKTHLTLAFIEAISIAKIAFPMILTGLLLYSRSMISMLFLGRLGELELAGVSLLWLNMKEILLFCGQDETIAREAQSYLIYSLPDLLAQSLLHPFRIYLRSQSITLPLTFCATLSIILHIPINYLLNRY
ncbi:hypothetical protein ACB092_07G069800 [Castanea dentata]